MEGKKSTVLWSFFQEGGPPNSHSLCRHHYIAKELNDQEVQLVLFIGSYSHLGNSEKKFSGKFLIEEVDNVKYVYVKTPFYTKSGGMIRIISWFIFCFNLLFVKKLNLSRPDYILVSSMPMFSIVNALLLKKKYKVKKVVLEIRDIWPLSIIQLGGYKKYNPLIIAFSLFEKWAYKKADEIISVLPNAETYIKQYIDRPNNFTWIPNGISKELTKTSTEISQNIKNQIPNDKFIVGYTGALGIANANEVLLESALKLADNKKIHFVIVGDGPLKENYVSKYDHLENITFIPKVKKLEVQSVIKHFDITFIAFRNIPIYEYGIAANKLFDYMLASKPILISANIPSNIVEKSGCGISVAAESVKEVTSAILKLSSLNPSEINHMGQLGFEYLQLNHTYDNLSSKLLETLDK